MDGSSPSQNALCHFVALYLCFDRVEWKFLLAVVSIFNTACAMLHDLLTHLVNSEVTFNVW